MKTRLRQHVRRVGRYSRYLLYVALALATVLAGLYGAARFYWPDILARQGNVEQLLTKATGHTVRIEQIGAHWDNLFPGVRAVGIVVYGNDGQPSVRIAEARVSFSLLPLLWKRVEMHGLVLDRPSLTVMRADDGRWHIAGLETPQQAPSGALIDWVLRQRRLTVNDAELRLLDARDGPVPLTLSQLNIRLRNDDARHRLAVGATFPPALCRACSMDVDITGDPRTSSWSGEIDVQARGLDIDKLPISVRERLPARLHGHVDAALASDWEDAVLQAVHGDATVTDLQLPLADLERPLALRQAAADISWRVSDGGWRLDLRRLSLALAGEPWLAGRLRLVHSADENELKINHVELGDVTAFVSALQSEHPWRQRWAELRPAGALDDVQVRISGKLSAPSAVEAQARLVGVSVVARDRLPGLQGLSGELSLDLNGGELALDTRDVVLNLPTVFRAPLQAQRASGRVRWQRTDADWRVTGTDLHVAGEDGEGRASLQLELPHDHAVSPALHLRVDFKNGNGAHAARYYPAPYLSPKVLAWMESSFRGGRVVAGHLVYDGPIREFPFTSGHGRFELRARVRDGIYGYLPGWAPITHADAEVAVDGSSVRVTGKGRIGQLGVHDVRVQVRPVPGAAPEINVRATVDGPVAESLRVVQTATPRTGQWWPEYVQHIVTATGQGSLDLDLNLHRDPGERWSAEYRFDRAELKLRSGAGLEAATGVLRLNESGIDSGRVQATLFGGPLTLVAATTNGVLNLNANGRVLLRELLRANGAIAKRVSGAIDWSGTWNGRAQRPELQAELRLANVRARLPAPLNRPNGGFPQRIEVSTLPSGADALVLALQAGTEAAGRLAFTRDQRGWKFSSGRIELGKATAALPRQGGLQLGLTAETLDVDEWLPLLHVETSGKGDAGPGIGLPEALSWVSADIRQLGLFGRRCGRLLAHLIRGNGEWKAILDGDMVAGDGRFALTGDASRLQLDLSYLRLPEKQTKAPAAIDEGNVDPRRLPALTLNARSFEYRERRFGELRLRATPFDQGWRIEQLNVSRPEAALSINGTWRRRGDRHASHFNVGFNSDNMGATLDAWGAAEQMAEGKVALSAQLSWPGPPASPTLADFNGKVELTAEKGRFLQIKAGASRLFGLLDFRSIGRYLTLDFSSAFGKGFAFDEVRGTVTVERGNAYTTDFFVKGPSLGLGATGRVGLAAEDFDLVVEASPRLSDTLTFASWGIFGPQAAAAVFALQKLFKRQIQDGTRITYVVKGPWENPKVSKLKAPDSGNTAVPQDP